MENQINVNKSFVILEVLQEIFSKIFDTFEDNMMKIFNKFLFINSEKLKIFETNGKDIVLNIVVQLAIGFIFGIILYYSVKYLVSCFSGKVEQNFFQFFIKIFIISVVIFNFSEIINSLIDFNFKISQGLVKNIIFSKELQSVIKMWLDVYFRLFSTKTEIFSFDGILKLMYTYSIIAFIFDLVIRFITLKIIILIGPFALLTKTFKGSEYIFNIWLKTFIALVIIQNIYILIFQAILQIPQKEEGIIQKLIFVCSVFVILKINKYVKEIIGSISVDIKMPMSPI